VPFELYPLIILLLIPLSLFVFVPIKVRLTHRLALDVEYSPFDEQRLPREVKRLIDEIEDLGFEYRGAWRHPGHSHGRAVAVVMDRPRSGHVGKILIAFSAHRQVISLLFETRFKDGTAVLTTNSPTLMGVSPMLGQTVLWLPELHDPRRLYDAHVRIMDHLGTAHEPVSLTDDVAGHLRDVTERMYAHFVETGYFFRDEGSRALRPTWKGAFLLTWRQMPLIRQLCQSQRRRVTTTQLRELGVELDVE
jgi:hypothetical protein